MVVQEKTGTRNFWWMHLLKDIQAWQPQEIWGKAFNKVDHLL